MDQVLTRLSQDFWPPDRSFVAPNILAAVIQAVVVLTVLSIFWPPLRNGIHKFFDNKFNEHLHGDGGIHVKLDAIVKSHGEILQSHKDLHEKIDKITGE